VREDGGNRNRQTPNKTVFPLFLKMAWDEHLRIIQQAKDRVIEVGAARKPVIVP
jgi:hypothetical protein